MEDAQSPVQYSDKLERFIAHKTTSIFSVLQMADGEKAPHCSSHTFPIPVTAEAVAEDRDPCHALFKMKQIFDEG